MPVELEELRCFLIEFHRHGYAAEPPAQWVTEADGSRTIQYEQGNWKGRDNFFGGDPFSGQITVFFAGRPAWTMLYYGRVASEVADVQAIFRFLRAALRQIPSGLPLRGPREFRAEHFVYACIVEGDLRRYNVSESILGPDAHELYRGTCLGGLVNVRG